MTTDNQTDTQQFRSEKDTMGAVNVPIDAYWGAQTERSRNNFKIGGETLPQPLIEAMALVKKAAALAKYHAACHPHTPIRILAPLLQTYPYVCARLPRYLIRQKQSCR